MYGWRAKIGLMIPANNTVVEPELWSSLPEGVTLHGTRMIVEGPFDGAALSRMETSTGRCMAELSQSQVDVQAYACMSTSLVKGRAWDEDFTRRLAGGSVRLFTAAAATMAALVSLGIRRPAVLSPYPPAIHRLLGGFLAAYGLEPAAVANLEIDDYVAVNRVDPDQLYRQALHLVRAAGGGTDGLCLLATDLPTFPVLAALEQDTGLPVVSTNQAILWRALQTLAVTEALPGRGRLLAEMPAPPAAM